MISLAERAAAIEDMYEDRQESTQSILDTISNLINQENQRKKEQAEKGLDGLSYFIFKLLTENKFEDAEEKVKEIKKLFVKFPNWKTSEKDSRTLRQETTLILLSGKEMEDVVKLIEYIFSTLQKVMR